MTFIKVSFLSSEGSGGGGGGWWCSLLSACHESGTRSRWFVRDPQMNMSVSVRAQEIFPAPASINCGTLASLWFMPQSWNPLEAWFSSTSRRRAPVPCVSGAPEATPPHPNRDLIPNMAIWCFLWCSVENYLGNWGKRGFIPEPVR